MACYIVIESVCLITWLQYGCHRPLGRDFDLRLTCHTFGCLHLHSYHIPLAMVSEDLCNYFGSPLHTFLAVIFKVLGIVLLSHVPKGERVGDD
jgi:hypothetical protein